MHDISILRMWKIVEGKEKQEVTYSRSTRPMQTLHVVILVPLTQPWRRSLSRGGFLDVLVLGGEDVFSVGDGGEESMIL